METSIGIDGRMNGKEKGKRFFFFNSFDSDCDYDWINDAVGNDMKLDAWKNERERK